MLLGDVYAYSSVLFPLIKLSIILKLHEFLIFFIFLIYHMTPWFTLRSSWSSSSSKLDERSTGMIDYFFVGNHESESNDHMLLNQHNGHHSYDHEKSILFSYMIQPDLLTVCLCPLSLCLRLMCKILTVETFITEIHREWYLFTGLQWLQGRWF